MLGSPVFSPPMDGAGILFFGRNPAMMTLIDKELSAAGIQAKGFLDETLLETALDESGVRLLVIGGGVEEAPRVRLKELCTSRSIPVYEHFGGPTGLVENIESVLG